MPRSKFAMFGPRPGSKVWKQMQDEKAAQETPPEPVEDRLARARAKLAQMRADGTLPKRKAKVKTKTK